MDNLTLEEEAELNQLLKAQKSLTVFFEKSSFKRLQELCQKVRNGMVEIIEPNEEGEMSIKNWFNTIEDMVIRDNAIKNAMKAKNLDEMLTSLAESIELAFDWNDSPEGLEYWQTVYENNIEK